LGAVLQKHCGSPRREAPFGKQLEPSFGLCHFRNLSHRRLLFFFSAIFSGPREFQNCGAPQTSFPALRFLRLRSSLGFGASQRLPGTRPPVRSRLGGVCGRNSPPWAGAPSKEVFFSTSDWLLLFWPFFCETVLPGRCLQHRCFSRPTPLGAAHAPTAFLGCHSPYCFSLERMIHIQSYRPR